jgi:hypothetical protein
VFEDPIIKGSVNNRAVAPGLAKTRRGESGNEKKRWPEEIKGEKERRE